MEKTFSQQAELPSLPLPELSHTLRKYLASVRPLVDDEQFAITSRLAADFAANEGPLLHKELQKIAGVSRNWLEKWWEDFAYLYTRDPIYPLVNFGGSADVLEARFSQLEQAAMVIYYTGQYWNALRREELPVMRSRGRPWCMHQVYRLFNTTRLPGEAKDEIQCCFKTETEGVASCAVSVFKRGHVWRLPLCDAAGRFHSPAQLLGALARLCAHSDYAAAADLSCLTALPRADWANVGRRLRAASCAATAPSQTRHRLIQVSAQNAASLRELEESAFCVFLTDESPANDVETARSSLCGGAHLQWADKSLNIQIHRNARWTINADHSNIDAIVVVQMIEWVGRRADAFAGPLSAVQDSDPPVDVSRLNFQLDNQIAAAVQTGRATAKSFIDKLDMDLTHFTDYGNDYYRRIGVYGDTAIQMALQLAFYTLHKRLTATYETASTRQFFHGRTETLRTVTEEVLRWVEAMDNQRTLANERALLFRSAYQTHNRLMKEATEAMGCDRHLLGLQILANSLLDHRPALFSDAAWQRSGGGGNFTLSTSFVGYGVCYGGVAPMCTDCYGSFYRISKNRVTFFLTAWKDSEVTRLPDWSRSIVEAMRAISPLLQATGSKQSAELRASL